MAQFRKSPSCFPQAADHCLLHGLINTVDSWLHTRWLPLESIRSIHSRRTSVKRLATATVKARTLPCRSSRQGRPHHQDIQAPSLEDFCQASTSCPNSCARAGTSRPPSLSSSCGSFAFEGKPVHGYLRPILRLSAACLVG